MNLKIRTPSAYAGAFGATLAAGFDVDAVIIYSGSAKVTATTSSARTAAGSSSSSVLVALGLAAVDVKAEALVNFTSSARQFARARIVPGGSNSVFKPNLPGDGNGLQVNPGRTTGPAGTGGIQLRLGPHRAEHAECG